MANSLPRLAPSSCAAWPGVSFVQTTPIPKASSSRAGSAPAQVNPELKTRPSGSRSGVVPKPERLNHARPCRESLPASG